MTGHGWTKGQEVRVFDVNGSRVGQPEGGWIGEVSSVGRKLFYVNYAGKLDSFRMENGRRADIYGNRYVQTLDQVNHRIRAEHARATLLRHGFDLTYPRPPLAKLEAVASLLDTMDD